MSQRICKRAVSKRLEGLDATAGGEMRRIVDIVKALGLLLCAAVVLFLALIYDLFSGGKLSRVMAEIKEAENDL